MPVDLHLHTTASDGRLTPAELVARAAQVGLSVIGITDHDSTDGVAEALAAAKDFPGLRIIPGVELSTDVPRGEVHILGYYVDYKNESFQERLRGLRQSREGRAQQMVKKLADLGMPLSWERVLELSGDGAVGRPHIAMALLERGYISSLPEAFDKYIGRNSPAYAEREKMTPTEAVQLVARLNGLPVLAHPGEIENREVLIEELKTAGLVGMEVYYDGYPAPLIEELLSVAQRHGLVATGGSDYHGLDSPQDTEIGSVFVPDAAAAALFSLAQSRLTSKEVRYP